MPPVPGDAVHDRTAATELGPADAAMLAASATFVVVIHESRAKGREALWHSGADGYDNSAGLMASDHWTDRARRRGRGAVMTQIATAHA